MLPESLDENKVRDVNKIRRLGRYCQELTDNYLALLNSYEIDTLGSIRKQTEENKLTVTQCNWVLDLRKSVRKADRKQQRKHKLGYLLAVAEQTSGTQTDILRVRPGVCSGTRSKRLFDIPME